MGRMSQVHRGLSIPQAKQSFEQRREEDDDQVNLVDERFNHSWAPNGHGPKPCWYWIPNGTISLDTHYLARPAEATRFGHLAKSSTCPFQPVRLAGSFRCWFVKKYCWLVCVREKYYSGWKFTIVYDKPQPNEQAFVLLF